MDTLNQLPGSKARMATITSNWYEQDSTMRRRESNPPRAARSLRVAQVTPLYSPYVGGVERHVREIVCRLNDLGMNVEVLTTDPSNQLSKTQTVDGVTVRRFPGWAPNKACYCSLALFGYLMRHANDYDLIHAHNYHALPAAMTLMIGNEIPKVLTTHYHGRSASPLRNGLLQVYKQFARVMLPRAARIICVSDTEAQLLERDFPCLDQRTTVIPNGVDLDGLARATPFDLVGRSVLYVGRLESYKNIDRIICALRYLEDHSLYLVGDGPERESLVRLGIQLGVNQRIHWLDNLTDGDLYRWYRSADVVVNLSRLESFGLTVLEAAVTGAPLVLSDIPVFRSLEQDLTGIRLVPQQTSDWELAKVIREMSTKGRFTRDVSEYSWETVVSRTIAVYERALNASGERTGN